MKVGSLVRWIGFPGATVRPELTGPTGIGIIIEIYADGVNYVGRVDVLWSDGALGKKLYPQTIEVVENESN